MKPSPPPDHCTVAVSLPESVHEAGVELRALQLILEKRALSLQRLVLRILLDRVLRVNQHVLQLIQHFSGVGCCRGQGRGACVGVALHEAFWMYSIIHFYQQVSVGKKKKKEEGYVNVSLLLYLEEEEEESGGVR